MQVKALKTVRFTQLVEQAGQPVPVILWTAPEDDRDFSKAVREQRVLTIIQQNVGSKTDYGLVGFFKQPLSSYLIFPKKLPYSVETKVVGIKYELLAESKPAGEIYKPPTPKPAKERAEKAKHTRPVPKPAQEPPPPPPPPPVYRFRAQAEIITRQTVPIEVEAHSASEAARLLEDAAADLRPDFEAASVSRRVSKPKRI